MARELHYGDPGRQYGAELIGDADPRIAYRDELARRANLAKEAGATQRLAGSEVHSATRNFLRPEDRQPAFTTPAGVSQHLAPLQGGQAPGQSLDPHQARIAAAQAARGVEAQTRLSGSHAEGHSRFAPGGFDERAIPGVRHGLDWSAIGEYDGGG